MARQAADALYLRFIQAYAIHVARLDPDVFDGLEAGAGRPARRAARTMRSRRTSPSRRTRRSSCPKCCASMARAWEGTSARLLRQAKGAPEEAALGLVVQEMAQGIGQGISGSGVIQFVDPVTGQPQITGRYLGQSQGRDALKTTEALYLTRDPRGPSLEDVAPEIFADAGATMARACRARLREEMQIEFTIEDGRLAVLDAVKVQRSARAGLRIAVALAEDGVIPQRRGGAAGRTAGAVGTSAPPGRSARRARRVRAGASRPRPGAATGRLVFSSAAAQASCVAGRALHPGAARNRARGYPRHAFGGGGADRTRRHDQPRGGDRARAGAALRRGRVGPAAGRAGQEADRRPMAGCSARATWSRSTAPRARRWRGRPRCCRPRWTTVSARFWPGPMRCATSACAPMPTRPPTPQTARKFEAQGIGLCRTEHMFFDEDRLVVMREMIFADTPQDRAAALARLLPMQRADFVQLFEIMQGLPVCIRLFDPPLHEFLPQTREGLRELAEALDRPLSEVTRRAEALTEVNPMLGMRGVRLGVVLPEIYDMQAQAIFEATSESRASRRARGARDHDPAGRRPGARWSWSRPGSTRWPPRCGPRPGRDFDYKLGVMVETPRAALRAGEIAQHAAFLSFGTNDLTQMTYGLSRDDAGRFMNTYVQQGVFPEDPFHILDVDGVGELLHDRGRTGPQDPARPDAVDLRRAWRQPGIDRLLPPAPGSTMCPARPTGCRWRGWRRRIWRSTDQAKARLESVDCKTLSSQILHAFSASISPRMH